MGSGAMLIDLTSRTPRTRGRMSSRRARAKFALAGAWSAHLDYDYYDFGSARANAGGTPLSIDVQQHVGRVGISYALTGGR